MPPKKPSAEEAQAARPKKAPQPAAAAPSKTLTFGAAPKQPYKPPRPRGPGAPAQPSKPTAPTVPSRTKAAAATTSTSAATAPYSRKRQVEPEPEEDGDDGEPVEAQDAEEDKIPHGREVEMLDEDEDAEEARVDEGVEDSGDEDDDEEGQRTIPPDLIARLLHECFKNQGTRITQDANAAVASYIDTFVDEAIARAAMERPGGFLEVDDLEKIAPQLLMDF